MTWFYMSFCDPDLPKGTQFIGACIVEAPDFIMAIQTAHFRGINPGGEVMSWELQKAPPEEYQYRLMSREELEAIE